MQENRETHGLNGMGVPDAGVIMEAQRAATENASKIANAACHYAISMNRAWLELWDHRLDEYFELPKRFAEAQTNFLGHAFEHYQESMQKLGGLASKMTEEAQAAVRETQAAGDRAARHVQQEGADQGWGSRPKEMHQSGGGEERREQRGAH
jgi:hypothetical protein